MTTHRLRWVPRTLGILLALSASAYAQFTAAPGSPFVVGAQPASVAVGDFNGDGRPDIAIANYGSNSVTVLLGDGAGGFTAAPGSPFAVGAWPVSVAVGDFNGDGKRDLAIANHNDNTVTVLLGNGAGGFTPAPGSPITVGSWPSSVAVGDFNGDGRADLAVANEYDGTVTMLLGNGTGGFAAAPGSPLKVGSQPRSLAVGDFNGDGKTDLVIANYGTSNVTVLLGNGAGGFAAAPGSPFSVGWNPQSVAVADFNGDGKPDLAIANSGSGTVSVLLGDGTGYFATAPGQRIMTGGGPVSVTAGDFNGDGKADLAVANQSDGTVSVLLGDGAGGFTAASGSPFTVGSQPSSVAVGDFNRDLKPDLAVANQGSDSVTVLLNGIQTPPPTPTPTPAPTPIPPAVFTAAPGSPFPVGWVPASLAVGDFNGDGRADLAIANSFDNTVTVLLGTAAGGLAAGPGSLIRVGSSPRSVAVGDFNGDGKADLAVANWGDGTVTVFLGDGAAGFTAAPGSPFAASAGSLVVGDFNRDGKPDLAVVNGGTVLLGTGTGGFTTGPPGHPAGGTYSTNPVAGDFNGDGKLDLVIGGWTPPTSLTSPGGYSFGEWMLLGDGTGGFGAAQSIPVLYGDPAALAVGDFNRDGKLDLAIAFSSAYWWGPVGRIWNYQELNTVAVMLGDGAGGFTAAPGSPFSAGTAHTSMAVGDFNGDGELDLAVGNSDGTVSVLLGDGTGGFATGGGRFAVGRNPVAVVAGDFNGDGRPDLAIANPDDNTVTVLLNGSTTPIAPVLLSPVNGATGYFSTTTLRWSAEAGATSYDVYFGTSSPPPLVANTTATSYATGTLTAGLTYYWRIVAKGGFALGSSDTWWFWQEGPPAPPVLAFPANGARGTLVAPPLAWKLSNGATSYDVYLGTIPVPPLVGSIVGTTYSPGTLSPNTTYYWRIVAQNSLGSGVSETRSFTTGVPSTGLRFIPVAPCRVADTRNAVGPFGGPTMAGYTSRSFAVPQSGCGIPSTAQAYSLNVTAVPQGPLGFLTVWPTGSPQPVASTLNSWDGTVVANAAIVPAGTDGAVSVFVLSLHPTDVVLDVNGYFDSADNANAYAFYPATPCRVADTRGPAGLFGGPSMFPSETRGFPIAYGSCGIPGTAQAYSLNVTVVPQGPLGFLTAWPTGAPQPNASTLNSWDGRVLANAAIVPAGTNGSINIFVLSLHLIDVVLDINGYFGPPGNPGALRFYPMTPCRVADTRTADGPFGGPEMAMGETRSFEIPVSACSVPTTAAAYSVNVTVVPDVRLRYLTAWATGSAQPNVSTLNSFGGTVVANAAIVPAGVNGAISVYVTEPTQVVLDIDGYFAP